MRPRVAAEPGRDRVRLVDQQQAAEAAGQLAQAGMEAGFGQHHAAVGQHRLGDDAGDVAMAEFAFQAIEIVEFDDPRRLRIVAELAGQAGTVDRPAIAQPHEGFLDGAMVAAVEDQDLRPAGDGAGDAQRKAVGIACRGGDLPERQAEHRLQLPADGHRVLVRQHVCQAALGLAADGAGDRLRRMAEHRTGVAEAEIVERVAVDVGKRRVPGAIDQDRERHRPVEHPVHRHAAEIAGGAAADHSLGSRPGLAVALGLARPYFADPRRVDAVPKLCVAKPASTVAVTMNSGRWRPFCSLAARLAAHGNAARSTDVAAPTLRLQLLSGLTLQRTA